jgi:putative ABC transport system ATP-binding protein
MLEVRVLAKSYGEVPVFQQVSLQIAAGEFVVLIGESGVGKSTLLNCIAGLEEVDSGDIQFRGQSIAALDADARARWRRERGVRVQAFHVLPHLNVADNVALPLLLLKRPDAARVGAMLERVGLQALAARWPAQLSGGQLQRVALARAGAPPVTRAGRRADRQSRSGARHPRPRVAGQPGARGRIGVPAGDHSPAAAKLADRVLRLEAQGLVDASPIR